ncbi:hypothetical protein J6590_093280, partial [Homalodisca vitripennis]
LQKKVIRIMCKLNPRESCRDAFREHGFLTLPCLCILDVALYCRFRCELVRGSDVHRYDTRGGDSYRMQHHRTLASEQLPSQAGVRLINNLPESINVNNPTLFKARPLFFRNLVPILKPCMNERENVI